MTKEDGIVLRVFDYGYSHANRHYYVEDDVYVLSFPTPVIIYLAEGEMPETVTMRLECKGQESFTYRVSTVNYLKMTRQELEDKNMIILIPFQLIRMRKIMEKERSAENLDLLKNIIQNDILGSIRRNLDVGNITEGDERKLRRLTHLLYEYLYAHYDEMEELNEMTDESLMLDIDIIEKEHERQIKEVKEEVTKEVTEKVTEEVTKEVTEKVTEEVTKEVTEKVTEEVTEKVTGRVARLTKEILRLTAQHDSTSEIAVKLGVTEEQVNEILDA
ncbi:MAG: hypothetical protein PHE02_04350 [Lachnospiraceae bacterium]|nr:hypothetical protein [Lachnospiraceae bacterium]